MGWPDQGVSPSQSGAADVGRGGQPSTVLHVSHTSQPGGAELALARLLAASARTWRAQLVSPDNGDAFARLPAHGVLLDQALPALPTGGTRRGGDIVLAARYLRALRAGADLLRRNRLFREAELVHANTAAAAIMCALADPKRTKPLVVHLRDLVTPESLGRMGLAAFTRIGLRRADGVIANSAATWDSAQRWLRPGVTSTVLQSPAGIIARGTARVREAVTAVGMIGRLQAWKGQHVFLRAFADVFRGTDVRARIAGAPLFGTADFERELRGLAADLGISAQVEFLGHVDDVPGFLDSIDLLVHASTRPEPFGQTVVQGLAHSLPVIATEGGGPSEWIRSGVNGLLIPPGSTEALARAMRDLAGSATRRAALAAGAAATSGILTDDECAQAHAAFFDEVRQLRCAAVAR